MSGADVSLGTRFGKYRITGRLGQGGMGVVYAGEDRRLRRPVAIKLLAGSLAQEPEFLHRFLLEARAAALLNHPNVVTVHDIGQRGGAYYIVMELVGGGSAQARLQARGALPWPEATRIAADVCRGLAAAHAAGLLHRDVKPANILLAADGVAKLADFGLTKAPALVRSSFTQMGTLLGTPQYMSPEHCTREVLDERADLYSLGATYYTLLTGRPPYDGPDPVQLLYAHCSAPVPDPRAVVPSLPAGCAAVVARAMAKARSERFRTAGDMLAALLDLRASPPALALPPPLPVMQAVTVPLPAPPPRRSRPWMVLGLGGLSLLLVSVCVLAGGFFRTRPAAPPAEEGKEVPAAAGGRLVLRPRPAPLLGHKGPVKAVSIAGGRLASAGEDGIARVWALDGGAELRVLHHPAALQAVALSPDGKRLAAGGDGQVVFFWDAVSGQGLQTLPNVGGTIHALAFAPNGKQLAVASANNLQLCDVEPPATVHRRAGLLGKQYVVASAAFSRDGTRLAACTYAGAVHLWDVATLKHTTAPGEYPGNLTAVTLSADGRRVAFATHSGVLHLWEPDRDTPPRLLANNEGSVAAVAFDPLGGTLVVAGKWGGPLRLRDLATSRMTDVPVGVAGTVNGICFAPDGRTLAAACSDGSVRVWDVQRIMEPE